MYNLCAFAQAGSLISGAGVYMQPGLIQFLIVCPLVGLAGFIDAVAGGGGLIALPAYMFAGLSVHEAIGTSKLSATMGSTLATIRYARAGYIPLKITLFCVAAALAGSSIGANISLRTSDFYLKIIILILLPFLAWRLTKKNAIEKVYEPYDDTKTLVLSLIISFVIGMYDGFYGPGTGTFMIILFVSVAHLSLDKAQGISKAVNLASTAAAMVIFLNDDKTIYSLGIAAGICNLIGAYLGTRFYGSKGARAVKPVMLVVLAVFFIRIVSELIRG